MVKDGDIVSKDKIIELGWIYNGGNPYMHSEYYSSPDGSLGISFYGDEDGTVYRLV